MKLHWKKVLARVGGGGLQGRRDVRLGHHGRGGAQEGDRLLRDQGGGQHEKIILTSNIIDQLFFSQSRIPEQVKKTFDDNDIMR